MTLSIILSPSKINTHTQNNNTHTSLHPLQMHPFRLSLQVIVGESISLAVWVAPNPNYCWLVLVCLYICLDHAVMWWGVCVCVCRDSASVWLDLLTEKCGPWVGIMTFHEFKMRNILSLLTVLSNKLLKCVNICVSINITDFTDIWWTEKVKSSSQYVVWQYVDISSWTA